MDHKTAPFWSKSEQSRQTDRIVPPPYNGCVKHPKKRSTHKRLNPYQSASCRHTRSCPASYRRSFFSAKPTFFREAAFSSGGEGCEWGAKQPTVSSEWGYNGENSFSALSPFIRRLTKGLQPLHPRPRLFVIFHPSKATIPPNLTKSSSRYQK